VSAHAGQAHWLLETGIAFYPPVPTARDPLQLVAMVEVNAVVDTYRFHKSGGALLALNRRVLA
jgi:hypothetical protein